MQYGYTALMWAALKGKADCVRLLLEGEADENAKASRVRVALISIVCVSARVLWPHALVFLL